jgi:hypothetical protein
MNKYISYLNKFNIGSPEHDKIFDEYISVNEKFNINIPTKVESYLKTVFDSDCRTSIILTGNAGDGKTRLCRQIHDLYASSPLSSWTKQIVTLPINGDRSLCLVKDLSELPDQIVEQVLSDLQDQLSRKLPRTVYLIAANEGKLTKFLATDKKLKSLYDHVTDRLQDQGVNDEKFQIINLNNVCTSTFVRPALKLMLEEDKWEDCFKCENRENCIIYYNRNRLLIPNVQKRLELLYKLLDYTQIHVTIRDLLIHLAHVITGGLSCRDIHNKVNTSQEQLRNHVYYENCWGRTLTEDLRDKIEVIKHFSKFDAGNYSYYPLDDYILNGETAEGDLLTTYYEMFGEKNIDMGRKRFLRDRQLYFTEQEREGANEFITNWLPKCRRKAFFELDRIEYVIRLLPFRFLLSFIETITAKDLSYIGQVKKDLVVALNKCFCGLPIEDDKKLYITANYAGPEKRSIPVIKKKIDLDDIKLQAKNVNADMVDEIPCELRLVIDKEDSSPPKDIFIDLTLFEYLMRVRNGGTFNILAEECSLRLSSFRDDILDAKQYKDRKDKIEFFRFNGSRYEIEVLYITEDGEIQ